MNRTKLFSCAAAVSLGLLLPTSHCEAAVIAISNTFASSEVSTDRAAIHATNGSNLNFTGTSGQEGNPANYTHTASATEFGQGSVNWLSKTASAVGASNAGEHWFAVDLGASYIVDTLNFFNFGTNTGSRNTRGTNQATVWAPTPTSTRIPSTPRAGPW